MSWESERFSGDASWQRREDKLPLPGEAEGYRRVLLLGATGAGKTTLVRQLLGSHPRTERFPSTSSAKTTTSDLELILTPEQTFRAVVSFLPLDVVRSRTAECLSAAVSSVLSRQPDAEIARRLLHHEDQRFRLEYVLGRWIQDEKDLDDCDELADGSQEVFEQDEALTRQLRALVAWVKRLASDCSEAMARSNVGTDAAELEDFVESWLPSQETYHRLVDSIVGECRQRIQALPQGTLTESYGSWPDSWCFESDDRTTFLDTIRTFSSNHYHHFGRLLTPLVDGLRVAGPFSPEWHEGPAPRLVLLDGEGLGHDPRSAASLPTRITRRFPLVDTIALIDNATQPMQASAQATLRRVAASGHESKLLVTFTRMDHVRADNLPDQAARRAHVRASLENAIAEIGRSGHPALQQALETALQDRVVFLGYLDQHPIPGQARATRRGLEQWLELTAPRPEPPTGPEDGRPRYDRTRIEGALQRGVESFRDIWAGRLGIRASARAMKEHFTRIRALTRRLGELGEDEYKNLQPAAELLGILQESLGILIESPQAWDPAPPEQASERTARVRRLVFAALHDLVQHRLIDDARDQWLSAYRDHSGTGSASRRADAIEQIISDSFPIGEDDGAQALRDEMWQLIEHAVLMASGTPRLAAGTVA